MSLSKKSKLGMTLYPILVVLLLFLFCLFSPFMTKSKLLSRMKLDANNFIFDEATCSCDTILNKLNYIIKNGIGSRGSILLHITIYDSKEDLPTTAKENDIAVITPVDYPNYYIGDTEPESKIEGTLWLHYGDGSDTIVRNEEVALPVRYLSQYQNGNWVPVKAYVYHSRWQEMNDQSIETASKQNILAGYTAVVNGKKIEGTLSNNGVYFKSHYEHRFAFLRYFSVSSFVEYANENSEYYTTYISYVNDAGVEKSVTIGTDSLKTTYTVSDVFNISNDVVAVIYSKETITTDTDNKYVSNTVYYLMTLTATATDLKKVSTITLNTDYTGNSTIYTDTTAKSVSTDFQFYTIPGYTKLYTSGSGWVYQFKTELQKTTDYVDDNDSNKNYTATSYKTSLIRINGLTGSATALSSASCSDKFYDMKETWDTKVACGLTLTGLMATTYTDLSHTEEVSTKFQDPGRTIIETVVSTKSIETSDAYKARNFRYDYHADIDQIDYFVNLEKQIDQKKITFTLSQVPLNQHGIVDISSFITSSDFQLDLTQMLGSVIDKVDTYYATDLGSFYITISSKTKEKVYLILDIHKALNCSATSKKACLSLQLQNISFRPKEEVGKKISSVISQATETSVTVIEMYR